MAYPHKVPIPLNQSCSMHKAAWNKTYTHMITDFKHSYKNYYKEVLKNKAQWKCYKCPNPDCGAEGCFARHASYDRHLVVWEEGGLQDQCMQTLRLRCTSCGTTHAILPWDAIPFWQFSVQAVLILLSMSLDGGGSHVTKTADETLVPYQVLYRFLSVFQKYMACLSLLLRQMAYWTEKDNPAVYEAAVLCLSDVPPFPQMGFFLANRLPLFLNRRNTGAYRFFVGGYF